LLVATACASPPEGRARWTLELLAGAMVKLTEHKSLSHETVNVSISTSTRARASWGFTAAASSC